MSETVKTIAKGGSLMFTAPELKLGASRAGHEPIPNIHIMEDHDGACDVWKTARVQGRILVHFDGHLDFGWIADRSAEELLTARSSEELNRLKAEVANWNLGGKPQVPPPHSTGEVAAPFGAETGTLQSRSGVLPCIGIPKTGAAGIFSPFSMR